MVSLWMEGALRPELGSPGLRQAPPQRRDGLWQHTCLEAFVALPGSGAYWEINGAPNGDWAVYRFSGYRSGRESPEAIADPDAVLARGGAPLASPDQDCVMSGSLRWRLPDELQRASALDLSVCLVLECADAGDADHISHWATAHCGEEADFHRRDSLRIRL
ncbi:DOMON-like domain-containing protein [Synechococcus sp. RSCCF101]|uniref:DOMON-like domain-containing protein n=1 Tax=Synechococcus sp. RSCCF101 TaxID=2511069 RepID=UPI001247990E|nr:DOMON-like domain-containing protein [Synechococcus sp. RSCCF101]QEY31576.1 DOMON-like domain-containing protein [Synechococcus sp. RSCCF101]